MRDTLYELLMEDGDISSFIYTTKYQNVWLLPNVEETAAIEPELIRGAPDSYFRLRDKLRQYAIENFDYTLIDDPPNMGTFVLMSLCASDFALVPIKAGSTFSIQGLVRAVQRIKEVSENYNHDLRFLRLLINMVDRRTVVGKATVTQVKDLFSATEVFETIIPVNAAFESAESARETILRFDSSSTGAKAIRSLAEELIVILESEAML
jgi:cellulose biosynthesis protein BcsQ